MTVHDTALKIVRALKGKQPHGQELADVADVQAILDPPACKHGVAMDVHCCNCHAGFLFTPEECVCESGLRCMNNYACAYCTTPFAAEVAFGTCFAYYFCSTECKEDFVTSYYRWECPKCRAQWGPLAAPKSCPECGVEGNCMVRNV